VTNCIAFGAASATHEIVEAAANSIRGAVIANCSLNRRVAVDVVNGGQDGTDAWVILDFASGAAQVAEIRHCSNLSDPDAALDVAIVFLAKESAAGGSLLANLVKLRDQGTAYYENVFVPGRNAMQEIMGAVYSQFHAAKSSPTYKDNLKVLSTKLKEYGVTVRSTSTDASLFIRMVFEGFDDKQVSIYSRSLAAAYEKGVAPDAFGKFRDKLKVAMMRRDQTERTLKQLQSEIDADSKEKAVA
jgi:hypothetical protein